MVSGRIQSTNKEDSVTLFIIENVAQALDNAGGWLLDGEGYLQYKPLEGQRIGITAVIAPINRQFIIVEEMKTNRLNIFFCKNIAF